MMAQCGRPPVLEEPDVQQVFDGAAQELGREVSVYTSLDPRSEQASRQADLNESGGLQTTARSGPQSPEALG